MHNPMRHSPKTNSKIAKSYREDLLRRLVLRPDLLDWLLGTLAGQAAKPQPVDEPRGDEQG
jgi:hypothetical protein